MFCLMEIKISGENWEMGKIGKWGKFEALRGRMSGDLEWGYT
jgi:hypothetical protein